MNYIQYLEWDSKIFKKNIGKLNINSLNKKNIGKILDECKKINLSCLFCFVNINYNTINIAQENKFDLINIKVGYNLNLKKRNNKLNSIPRNIKLEDAKISDIKKLIQINNYVGKTSRFYKDKKIKKNISRKIYREWIKNSLKGYADKIIVLKIKNEIYGFISCKIKNKIGIIDLIGVLPEYQGKGYGKLLINESIKWFNSKNIDEIEVTTEGENISAQRLYQKIGFRIYDTKLVYHKWFTPN